MLMMMMINTVQILIESCKAITLLLLFIELELGFLKIFDLNSFMVRSSTIVSGLADRFWEIDQLLRSPDAIDRPYSTMLISFPVC